MTPADLSAAEQISDEAFFLVDEQFGRRADPSPTRRTAARSAAWRDRTAGLLATDPDGWWVAEEAADTGDTGDTGGAGSVVGFATSMVRGDLWVLSTFAVRPQRQGAGVGRALLAHAEQYGAHCSRSMLSASDDPRALRRYHAAGFELLPQLTFHGTPRPAHASGPATDLRPGGPQDLGWMDDLDRALRGGPHGPDHALMRAMSGEDGLLVADDRSGYAYHTGSALVALAARDTSSARQLLCAVLRSAAGRHDTFELAHVTAANRWAVDVAMAAGLSLRTEGYLALRGMDAPAPYVHNGALL